MKDYKKILEGVVNIIKTTEKSDIGFANICTYIGDNCPELKEKESEDEKIRKGLLKMFHHYVKNNVELIEYGLEKDKVIAWLEKQGEQKPADKEYTFKAIPRLLEMIEPNDRAKAYCQKLIDSLTQEGYATDARIVGECLKQMNGEKVAMATMDGQKPVEWSERDEERLISCINLLEVQSSIKGNKDTINTKWLKSLKYRVQPRQEWNKEDKDILSSIITRIEVLEDAAVVEQYAESLRKEINWLKSLRPSHWKPSDGHYELEEFAKIVRGYLTGISKEVQSLFENKYLQLTGNKMYGSYID